MIDYRTKIDLKKAKKKARIRDWVISLGERANWL